jgi:hypothetical protein
MTRLHASIFGLAMLALSLPAATASAQSSPDPKTHPGVWQDIMKAPLPQGPYGAGYTTTERVVERCTALEWAIRTGKEGNIRWYRRNYQTGYCLGFINAAMAVLNFHNDAGNHTLGVCMPEDMQSLDVIRTFLDYVHRNQGDMQYNPALLVYWSLLEKYPCKS